MVLGILGYSRSGKTAVANILQEAGFIGVGFADPLKRMCMELFDFTEEQLWGDLKEIPDLRYPRQHTWKISGITVRCECCKAVSLGKQHATPCYLTPRYAMQTLGTEGARASWSDIWVKKGLEVAADIENGYYYDRTSGIDVSISGSLHSVVFLDNRFINECDGIWQAGGEVYRVRRAGIDKPPHDHPSETEQDQIPDDRLDGVIQNDGTLEDLKAQVLDIFGR